MGSHPFTSQEKTVELADLIMEMFPHLRVDLDDAKATVQVEIRCDDCSLLGHKLYGPKGAGALYVRKGVRVVSVQQGGGHESGMRSATENVPGIVGLGRAARLAQEKMAEESERMRSLRDRMRGWILKKVDESWLKGHPDKRLPSNLNFGFRNIEGESLLLYLDAKGVVASMGSACSSKKLRRRPRQLLRHSQATAVR